MSDFVYNEETRAHTLDREDIPSVTQIIDPLTDFSMIPPKVLVRKTELGTEFHRAMHLYHLDDLDFDSIDPDLIKPMHTFIEWFKYQKDNCTAVHEKPHCNEALKYCGKIDRYSNEVITDFKLRPYNPKTDTLQMAGYEGLLDKRKRRKLQVVCFDLKGGIKIHDARNSQAWLMFVAMLRRHNNNQLFIKLCEDWKGAVK